LAKSVIVAIPTYQLLFLIVVLPKFRSFREPLYEEMVIKCRKFTWLV